MSNKLSDETILAFKTAVIESRVSPPGLGSCWFDPQFDDYFIPPELGSVMLALYKAGRARPWCLSYPLEYGNEKEKAVAKDLFYQWMHEWTNHKESADLFPDWLSLIKYFAHDDPSLYALFRYKPGKLDYLVFEDEDLFTLCIETNVPQCINDVKDSVNHLVGKLANSTDELGRLCTMLLPFRARVSCVANEQQIKTIQTAIVSSWHQLRFEPLEEGMLPLGLAWDRLSWMWSFGWEGPLAELCSSPLFVQDCLDPHRSAESVLSFAEIVAENIAMISLTSESWRIGCLPPFETMSTEHVQHCIDYIAQSFSPKQTLVAAKAIEYSLNSGIFPTNRASQEDVLKEVYTAGHAIDTGLMLLTHSFCQELWNLRLALALGERRRNVVKLRKDKAG